MPWANIVDYTHIDKVTTGSLQIIISLLAIHVGVKVGDRGAMKRTRVDCNQISMIDFQKSEHGSETANLLELVSTSNLVDDGSKDL